MINDIPPAVLIFAGNDPSGGAGLSADILTICSLGCHPLPVITAITVQDTSKVEDFLEVEAELVSDQARFLLEDVQVSAFKVGVVGSVENIAIIAEIAADYPNIPLIVDPVLSSSQGDEFASEEIIEATRELLLPHTTVLTPNSDEARRLACDDPDEQEDLSIEQCATNILQYGCEMVLITGTHENTPHVINQVFNRKGLIKKDTWERLPYRYHGSGCTLASAIAGSLANGVDLLSAIQEAQEYTYHSLKQAYRPGMGQHVPDRLFWARLQETLEDPPLLQGNYD